MVNKAVVVLSGGQDSTTCLYWALDRFGNGNVEALTFDYGQRHRIELDCAAQIAKHAGVVHTLLPIDTFAALGGNALTDSDIAIEESNGNDLPNTFVPGRNLIFLTFAAAFAWQRDIADLVSGASHMHDRDQASRLWVASAELTKEYLVEHQRPDWSEFENGLRKKSPN